MSEWFYATGDQQQGPVSEDGLLGLIQSGQVRPDDLVWNEGMTDWAPASEVFGDRLLGVAQQAPVGYVDMSVPEPGPAAPLGGVAAPTFGAGQPLEPPLNGMAVASLVVGILGIVGCACFPVGIVAIVLGHIAIHQINQAPDTYRGKGLAIGGLIMGYASLALFVLWIILSVASGGLSSY
ncbi:MAG: DUF4190 domain-containing protein [Candidatus Hydrogenedentes bacterium]|nr:DUF4190 domain-containing protein [Candidatus Hydrogenedentota bacterium]